MRAHRIDECQRVSVRADRGISLGRPEQIGHGVAGFPRLEEVMGDACRRGAELDEPFGGIAVDAAPAMGREVVEQRIAHERVTEAVSGARRLDDEGSEGAVEMGEGDVLGHSGQRDELVGVERGAHDRDPLQHLARRRLDARDHVGVECLDPMRLGSSAASQLVHRERDPPAERSDATALLAGDAVVDVASDEQCDLLVVQRAELDGRRAVSVEKAVAGLREGLAHRCRAVAEHDAHALGCGRPRDVVQQAKARVVRIVDVVDRQQKAVRPRREAHELGHSDEQSLVGAPTSPGRLRAGQRAVDLLAMMVGEAVEQRGVAPAHVGERLDDGRVRPRTFDRSRGARPHSEAQGSRAAS